jgi:hypothetical protein
LQDSLQEDDDEDDEDEQRYLNLNEEEGDVWDEDSAYIEMLAKEVRALARLRDTLLLLRNGGVSLYNWLVQGQRLREAAERKVHDLDVAGTSDVSDDEEIEEELGFISPLDAVNPYVTFKQALTGMFAVPPTTGSLNMADVNDG